MSVKPDDELSSVEMRRLLFYIICFFCASIMDAQKITIAQCECLPLDLSASINPREDLNGDKCALLKVEMATDALLSLGCGLGTKPRMATRQLIKGLMILKKQKGR